VVLSVCAFSVAGFFDFLKSSPKPIEQHVDTNRVRGAPEYLHAKFLKDPFTCDNAKTHSLSIVNDGFCDCVDRSDEPGTSACHGTVFHCINKGYKLTKIPSSRVDDGVCDCCDGSDEGRVANCSNTCDEVAASERAQLAKVTSDYKVGSAIRADLIRSVRLEKAQMTASVTPLGMEIHGLHQTSDEVQTQIDDAEERVKQLEGEVTREKRRLVRSELQIEALSFAQLSQLLSNLLKVLSIEGGKVGDILKDSPSPAAAHHRRAATAAEDTEELPVDEDDYSDSDPHAEHDHDLDLDNVEAPAVVAAAETAAGVEASCDVVSHSSDLTLVPLCDTITSADAAAEALVTLTIKKSAYSEISLLLAHHHAHGTFEESHVVVRQHLDSDSRGICPASFEAVPAAAGQAHLCNVRDSLPAEVGGLDARFGLAEARAALSDLRTRANEVRNKVSEVERKLKAAQAANEELVKHAEELEYLAMKDQCFDKEDGAFTYSLCILGAITQKEVVGHRSVTLGTHEAIEFTGENAAPVNGVVPSAILKYGGGQHCHAFGARTATVTVSCAATNALISATEPSTCAYRLHFESPAACTPKYAQQTGIATHATD